MEPTEAQVKKGAQAHRELIAAWGRGEANCDHEDVARAVLLAVGPDIAEKAWDEAYQAGAFDTLRSPREATENPYREEARRG